MACAVQDAEIDRPFTMSLREVWDRIAAWHKENAPRKRFTLAKGMSKRRLDAVEKSLGLHLPDDLRESYLLHNGAGWLLYFGEVMPLEAVEAMWRRYDKWQRENGYGL